jgi:hypothetical protein
MGPGLAQNCTKIGSNPAKSIFGPRLAEIGQNRAKSGLIWGQFGPFYGHNPREL